MRRQKTLFGILVAVILIGALALIRSQPWGRLDLPFFKADSTGWIVCVKLDANGNGDLVAIKPDGTVLMLTEDHADDTTPDWSPDGKKIVFSTNRQDHVYQLFTMDADGKNLNQLTIGGGAKLEPVYDHDGHHIIHIAQGIVTEIDPKGTHAEQILPPPHLMRQLQEQMGQLSFRYARRGINESLLAAVQKTDEGENVLFYSIDYSSENNLPIPLLNGKRADMDWARDSAKLVVGVAGAQVPEGPNSEKIVTVGLLMLFDFSENTFPSKPAQPLWASPDGSEAAIQPVWSPDGSQIAFVLCNLGKNGELKRKALSVVPSEGGEPTELVSGEIYDPNWSPDSKQLVYSIGSISSRQIETVDLRGNTKVLAKEGDYVRPKWSPKN
jgi:dipeptidyl aminopeptidase/acylaminoacyl peptidase